MFIIIGFNDVALQLHRQGKRNMIEEFSLQHKILEAYKKEKKKKKGENVFLINLIFRCTFVNIC